AAKFIILVTNEDRDISFPQHTFSTVLAGLNAKGFVLETIISANIRDAANGTALAIDKDNNAFVENGTGGFTVTPNGTITSFFDTSVQDYAAMAFATGGVAGDINQIQVGGTTATSFSNVLASQVVVQAGGGNPARPGDWRSIQLDQYANDRNVSPVVEAELSGALAGVGNGTPALSQFLGALAPNEKSGDENLRLGFDIDGSLGDRSDVDVYSFRGTAGTEVWLDIDKTSNALDTVLELVDSNGNVLARSNDSVLETANPSLLFRSASMPAGSVNPLRKAGYDPAHPDRVSPYEQTDLKTTNPRDAGLRIVLPGTPGSTATYHVRVRSNGPNLTTLNGGLTKGNYTLQVRLRELDEVPGSTVRYADIRYATNGVELLGLPAHSPLIGELAEVESNSLGNANNNTLGNSQNAGNVLETDRGAVSISGNLDLPSDVDFFQIEVEYENVVGLPPNPHASMIFDVDYTDGLARPNTTLWVFDSEGRLILRSTGSNVSEDRGGPLAGSDQTDLSRGSVGALDPYIGPVELPAGPDVNDLNPALPNRQVYYVAVTSNAVTAQVLEQYLTANVPANVASVRLEPVNSVKRIAEDRIGFSGGSLQAEPPEIPVLIDTTQSMVPFHLGDVTLFVSQDIGLTGGTISTLRTVDPFTGATETTAGSFAQPIADIAMRGDGNIFSYSIGPNNFQGAVNDASTGLYLQIDSATGASTTFSDDGIDTYVEDPMNPGSAIRPNNSNGFGTRFNALTFSSTSNSQFSGFGVATRNDSSNNNDPDFEPAGPDYLENILYNFDINTGVVRNPGGGNDRSGAALLTGAGTNKIELGEILTYTRITPQSPEIGDTFTITINGKSINYTASGGFSGFATVSEVVDGLATAWRTAALTIPEFAAFEVMNNGNGFGFGPSELRVRLINSAGANLTIQSSTTNGGSSLETINVDGFGPGGIVTGLTVLNGTFYAVTDRGGLFELFTGGGGFFSNNIATYVRSSAIDLMTGDNGQFVAFSGLTSGPQRAEGGKYSDMLFGISRDGSLYAFDPQGELQPVFVNNQTSVDTGLFNVSGLAFSTLDRNLWTVTGNRGADQGHGLNLSSNLDVPFDNSRTDALLGGNSIFFGNDRSASVGGNQSFSNTAFVRDYNFPGGAYGTVVSNPFSLKGYAAEDLPVMYFNYFLGTEDTDFDPAPNPDQLTRDTLRVFVSGDNGEWTLLATNDLWQDAALFDEFDIGQGDAQCLHPAFATEPCVQPLFDNSGWRQARIPLNRFAGLDNLRIRFDFSTAGDMNIGDTFTVGSELRVLSGTELRDGQTMTLDGNVILEVDLGYTLVTPNGAGIDDGDSFTIAGGLGGSRTFEFDSDGFFRRNIAAVDGMLLRDGDTFRLRVGSVTRVFEFDSGPSLHVPAAGGGTGGLRDGDSFDIDGIVFEFDTDGVVTPGRAAIDLNVDGLIRIPSAGAGTGGLVDGDQLVINDGLGGPDVVFEFDRDHPTSVAAGVRAVDISNIELLVPVAGGGFGGVRDGDAFVISDGLGSPDVVFEFDKNNSVTGGSRSIFITDQSTQDEVAAAVVQTLRQANIGLNATYRGGGAVRLGTFRHTLDTGNAPTVGSRFVEATQAEIAARLADSIVGSGLVLTPVVGAQGTIRLGGTVQQVDTTNAPSIQYTLLTGTQDEVANLIVDAVTNSPLPEIPINLGNGEIYLGRLVSNVNTTNAPALLKTGAVGRMDPAATPVVFSPVSPSTAIADAISAAINGSGLGITTTASQGIVQLPSNTSFSPNATPLKPAGVQPVSFTTQDSPADIATSIDTAIGLAFAPVTQAFDLSQESNDRLASAIDAGLNGGPAIVQSQGFIGDNSALGTRAGVDVDFVRLDLNAGERVVIDVGTSGLQGFNPLLRLFNAQGQELTAASQNQIDYRAVTTGTYYVAVSSAVNSSYNPSFEGSADVTLRVPTSGGGLNGLTDGETFTIAASSSTTPVVFEFDNNGVVSSNAISVRISDFQLQVPAAGAGPGGIRDQDSFVVNDNRGTQVRFEFDTDGATTVGSIPISIFPQFDTATTIAFRIQNALVSANLGLNPTVLGSGSLLLGSTTHSISVAGTPSLTATLRPRTQQEIVNLLYDALRTAPLGLRPTLSGAGGITLDITTLIVDATRAPNLGLASPSNSGAYSLSVEVVNPFATHRDGIRLNLIGGTDVSFSGLP
ncbi:MAG: pre-peptidase C-terminal domain-containing protein, partial [Pirellulaceae bacterium]